MSPRRVHTLAVGAALSSATHGPLRYRRYSLAVGKHHIRLRTLLNKQQFADPNGEAAALGISSATWPIFGVVWPAAQALAQIMETQSLGNQRILEVGCGIGLASLLLNARLADITATDQHPCAEAFLRHNVNLNNGPQIPFLRADWREGATQLGRFDLIIGSDLLYERESAALLAQFINAHALSTCQVILTDPGRGNLGKFDGCMDDHGYDATPISTTTSNARRFARSSA